MANPEQAASTAWGQILTFSEKLVAALDALDDAGGLHRLAADWKPAKREKAKATLAEVRKAVEATAAQLKGPTPAAKIDQAGAKQPAEDRR